MRRLIGLVMLLTGLAGACVGALGVVVSGPTVASAGREVDSLLAATSTTLTNTRQSLLVLKAALADLEDSAVTFESSAQESDRGLAQTQEVLDQAARITGQELPQSLDAVKRGMDSAAKPAAAIEAVMVAITNTPPFSTALAQAGVTYRPEVSLATSLQNTAAGLDAALRQHYPNAPRWDYGIGIQKGKPYAIWVEVHPADTSNVDEVLKKLAWLKDWLAHAAQPLHALTPQQSAYHWLATDGVHINQSSPQARQLNQAGLTMPRRVLNLDELSL